MKQAQIWGGGAYGGPLGGAPSHIQRWCARILHECVAYDKPMVLLLYMQLHHAALTIHWAKHSHHAWSLRMTLEFYSRASHHLDLTLLRRDFLEALRVHADAVVCSVSEEDVPYIDVLKSALVVLDG
mmetsp:Transcript_2517/g.8467  ORF Transcript_2517/g.8467 Transcript_2517/m.8467 type:complete len:127 (-) Transcript_2517:348-728(-)